MKVYINGTPARIEVPLVDVDGGPLVPTAISYRVVDALGVELVSPSPLDVPAEQGEGAVVTVPGELNQVPAGQPRVLRVIELTVTTERGQIALSAEYVVEVSDVLQINENSFQTYGTAVLTAMDIPQLPGWNRATKRDRIAALVQARLHIARLRFRYYFEDDQNFIESSSRVHDLTKLSMSEWGSLPDDFKVALARAQVLEADSLLGGDEIGDLRSAGVISKTTGESKAFFRANVRPIDGPVCSRARKELSKFILNRIRIGRIG